jgi:hypothetical protein
VLLVVVRILLAVGGHLQLLVVLDVLRAEDEGVDEAVAARFIVGEHHPEPTLALLLEFHCRRESGVPTVPFGEFPLTFSVPFLGSWLARFVQHTVGWVFEQVLLEFGAVEVASTVAVLIANVPRLRNVAVALEVVQHLVDGPGVVIVEFLHQMCNDLRVVTHSDTVSQCEVQNGTVSDVDAI